MAEEENVGFLKRMWRKVYIGEDKAGTAAEEKAQEAVTEEAMEPAEEAAPELKPKPEVKAEPEPTREEMLELIDEYLADYADEISARITKLVKKVDGEGKVSFLFKMPDGKEAHFKDLDDETLLGLYLRISNQAVLIRHEILRSQMQQLRRLERMQRPGGLPQAPPSGAPQRPGVQPPQVYKPPAPPAGVQPPQVHKPPALPAGVQTPPSPPKIPAQRR